MCTLGACLFVCGINLIIAPLGLYNGGFVGIGQLVRYVLEHFWGLSLGSIDLAGIIYFLLNIPLFILATQSMSKKFFEKTMYTVLLQAVLLALVPVPQWAFTADVLTACIIGGLVSGFGAGIILRTGASGGEQDILGIYFAKKYPGFSVGKITLIVNSFVYGCCAILFDLEIVVYSLLYTVVMSFIIDKVHIQNINAAVLILSKKPGLEDFIIQQLRRGVTAWQGIGGYTKEDITVALVALSKYELANLRRKLRGFDDHAFMVVIPGSQVYGNFEKRLES